MKKLLSGKEHFEPVKLTYKHYSQDRGAYGFEQIGEPRGVMKQATVDWESELDYVALTMALHQLGLSHYVEVCFDEENKKLVIRYFEEEDATNE